MGTQTSAVSSTDWPRDGEKVLMSCPCPTIMNKPSSDWFPSQADRTADFAQSVPSLEHAGRSIAPISDFDLEDDGFTYQVSVKLDSSLKFPTGSGEEPQPSVIGLSSCATPEGIRLRTSVAGKWYRNAETKPCENNGVPGKCFSYRAANHPLSVDVKRYPKPESQIGKWSRDTRAVDSVFQIGVLPDNGEWRPFVRDYWLPDGSQSNVSPAEDIDTNSTN